MKTYIFLAILCSTIFYSQSNPIITFASPTTIQGRSEIGSMVEISTNSDFAPEYSISADSINGNFLIKFTPPLNIGDNIIVWSIDENKKYSQKIVAKIEKSDDILQKLSSSNFNNRNFISPNVAGKTVNYKVTILNTNFSIPLARFNFTKNNSQKKGDLLLFNSIGAGYGISWGELSETRDNDGDLINQDFTNSFGIHAGFLFSAGTGDDTKNVFAPILNLSFLDFQLGVGYELGTLTENQKPVFLTLSYAIPLYKLKKGGFWIWKASEPISDTSESRLGE